MMYTYTMRMKKWTVVGLLLAVLLVAVGAATAQGLTRDQRAEMRFMQGMIDHHQMALDMAADCLERAATESLVTLCQNIIDAQSAEIELMQGWLLAWYNNQYTPMSMMDMPGSIADMHSGHGGHGSHGNTANRGPFIDPPMMMGMFAGFNQVEGIEYEIAWLEAMIDHHDDAIHMAERLLMRVPEGVGHAELLALAQQIIADQTAEIALMETLIAELGG